MLVVDQERSERGQQRKMTTGHRLLHCCCICGRLEPWSNSWTWYGSYKDLDDTIAIAKFCSPNCQSNGGTNAENVSVEMRQKAMASEWRDPEIVYREATDVEKYNAARDKQRSMTSAEGTKP